MFKTKHYVIRPLFILALLIVSPLHTFADKEKVELREPLRVVAAFPEKFPPQSFLNKEGEPVGFAIDVLNHVAKLANLIVIYKPEESFPKSIKSLTSGEADLLPSSGITPKRLLNFDFTIPVETFEVVIFVRKTTHDILSLADLKGRKVAVLPTNVGRTIIEKQTGVEGVIYNEISTAFFDLLSTKVDAFIYPKPVALKLAREAGIEEQIKIVGKPLLEIKRAMRVRKGDKLLNRLNPAIEEFLRSDKYREIYTKWYGTPQPYWTTGKVVMVMGAILLLVFIALITWRFFSLGAINRQLAQEIEVRKEAEELLQKAHINLEQRVIERTEELAASNRHLSAEILKREKLQKSLEESEENFRLIADYTYDWDTWFSPEGELLYSSPSSSHITGYDNEEFQADVSLMAEIVHPDDRDAYRQHHLELLPKPNKVCQMEFRIQTKNGQTRYLSHVCQAVFDRDGKYLGRRGNNRDTTERKALEEQLHRFKNTLDQAHDCVFMFAADTLRFFYVNQGAVDQVGYTKEELYQMVPTDIKPEISEIRFQELIKPLLDEKRQSIRFETFHQHKDGTMIPVDVFIQYVTSLGNESRFVAIVRDITEQKKIEDKLRKYGMQQKVLLQEVNHRVKNNLTAIISMLHQEEDRCNEQGLPTNNAFKLKEIVSRVEGLLIVHSLLSVSKWEPLYLNELCKEVVLGTLHGFSAGRNVHLDVTPSDVRVDADQAHNLAIVLNELATNTVKHGFQEDGMIRILVSIERRKDTIHLNYKDHGSGFSESVLQGDVDKNSIGVHLINGIIRKTLNGEVIFRNKNGAEVEISFPDHELE